MTHDVSPSPPIRPPILTSSFVLWLLRAGAGTFVEALCVVDPKMWIASEDFYCHLQSFHFLCLNKKVSRRQSSKIPPTGRYSQEEAATESLESLSTHVLSFFESKQENDRAYLSAPLPFGRLQCRVPARTAAEELHAEEDRSSNEQ
jgi:hypothetical protein